MAWVDVNSKDEIGGKASNQSSSTKTINYGTQGVPSWVIVAGLVVFALLWRKRG